MSSEKDELTKMMVKTFFEFLSKADLEWEKGYFRFVLYEELHHSTQWSYSLGRQLFLAIVDTDLESKYLDVLVRLGRELFKELEKEAGKIPIVCVVEIDQTQNYILTLDYDNQHALETSLIGLGQSRSYFQNNEIDIPEHVKEFQRGVAD